MNKIIAIGDLHGRDDWKKILEKEQDYDHVVFIGDYFDSWDLSAKVQMENFKQICALKDLNQDKITLLYGNHDLQYMVEGEVYSGHQGKYAPFYNTLLSDNEDFFQWAYEEDGFLFTHAGVTNKWCEVNSIDKDNLVESINQTNPNAFGFKHGGTFDRSGDDIHQSPCWVRPLSLLIDGVKEYKQVVGHTQKREIQHISPNDLWFIDVPGSYLVIENGEGEVRDILPDMV